MGLEVGLAFVLCKMVLKPGHHEFVEFRGLKKPLDDGLDHLAHRPVVLGHPSCRIYEGCSPELIPGS